MHRCLAVPELVRSIFSYLSQHKSTLVALVVTCRALRNPAMNELWYHVEGLPPLLMAMPKDLWLARPRTGNNVWQKPSTASRIRSLSICTIRDNRPLAVLPEVYLAIPKEDYPVFSNLRKIHIRSQGLLSQEKIHSLQLLLSGKIRSMELEFPQHHDAESCITILSALTCGTFEIASLSMDMPGLSKVPTEYLPSIIQYHWQNLQHLTLCAASHSTLAAFSYLQLVSLVVKNATEEMVTESVKVSSGGFPKPRTMELSSKTLSACIQTIQLLKQSPLKTLKASATDTCHPLVLRSFSNSLEKHIQHLTLEAISVVSEDAHAVRDATPPYAGYVPDNDPFCLEDQHPFTNLLILSITSTLPYTSKMSLDSILDLARRTPRLQVLCLGDFGDPSAGPVAVEPWLPRISLENLISITKNLPMLSRLLLSVDASTTLLPGTRPGDQYQHQNLTTLSVGYSPITSARNVAAFVSAVFPNMTCITASRPRLDLGDGFFARWEEVTPPLEMLRTVKDWEKQ
ncbi:hypothetical protein BKA70DRAFT_1187734 [Coprinopsis sp. MPI-PUGE-AT-0042]|nr:hypothetical protein BKA70DRAFT_1187734 [Coprinopsis sp. MPI-PUGE-AT-0042]